MPLESTLMLGRRHFRVEFFPVGAARGALATLWRESPNEAAFEDLLRMGDRLAREHGVEVDLVVAGERVGVRCGA